jgi:transcriptional regulator with XRE-family HTH domain
MNKSIYSEEYTVFLAVIRNAREQFGLTQGQLAAKLGVTQSFVSKCERGERRLDVVEFRTWCLAIGVPIEELVHRFDDACIKR